MKPTTTEVDQLIDALINKYNVSTRFLNILIKESVTCTQLIQTIGGAISNEDKVRLLVNQRESLLFSGSGSRTKELRSKLLAKLPSDRVDSLFEKYCKSSGSSQGHKINKLSSLRWHTGKDWPLTFVKELGLPKIFAGIKGDSKLPNIEDVDPFIVPPELKDFQIDLKDKLLSTLKKEGDNTRCVISLPTGGGKTRTAVEAFIEWLQPRFSNGEYLIWIAQSEELCEQAIECIKQMWASKVFNESLRVYRYFGSSQIMSSELRGGVVVSSINQLYTRLSNDPSLVEIVNKTVAIIIDEAHRAATSMYTDFFRFCKIHHSEELFPICGLTATPGRSHEDTPRLVSMFDSTLFTPDLGAEFEENPLEYFRVNKYLARPIPQQIETGIKIPSTGTLFDESKDEFRSRMERDVIKDLAVNKTRNRKIIEVLRNIPSGKQTIVYACTVQHAEFLSTVMNHYNRPSTAISSNTPRHYRRKLLEQFKNNDIEFVFNYGVLTTGFDAPRTEYIVICRPTFSEVLYEQIVGRGLRGPQFRGTEYCHIIDFCDNYERFGDQQAYNRFTEFWGD